jgi:hypothetical protein
LLEFRHQLLNKEFFINFLYEEKSVLKIKTKGPQTFEQILENYERLIEKAINKEDYQKLIFYNDKGIIQSYEHICSYNKDTININIISNKKTGELYEMEVRMMVTMKSKFVKYNPNEAVIFLKQKIQDKMGTPPSQQMLLLGRKKLDDIKTPNDYNVRKNDSVSLISRGYRGGMFHISSGLVDYEAVKGYMSDISKLNDLIGEIKSCVLDDYSTLDYFLSQLNP